MSNEEKQVRGGQLYREGRPQREIAELLGVSENTICQWKKRLDWGKSSERFGRAQQREEAFILYRAGQSQQDIGRSLSVSENSISSWKKRGKWDERLARLADTSLRNDLIQLGRLVQAHAQQQQQQETPDRPRAGKALRRAYANVCRELDYEDLAAEYGGAAAPPPA